MIRKIDIEWEDHLLKKNGFDVVIGTNTCYFKGVYYHRKEALMLAFENINRIKHRKDDVYDL